MPPPEKPLLPEKTPSPEKALSLEKTPSPETLPPARRLVVDRIEETIALVEIDGVVIELPASLLPEGAGEGALLDLVAAPDGTLCREGDALRLPDGMFLPLPAGVLADLPEGTSFLLVPARPDGAGVDPAEAGRAEAEARLERLRAKTPQGPGTFEL